MASADDSGHDITDKSVSPFVPTFYIWLMISIVMTDAGGQAPMSQPGSHAPCTKPGDAWVRPRSVSVCLNGLTQRLVTTNTGGLSRDPLSHVIANRETDHHFVSIT